MKLSNMLVGLLIVVLGLGLGLSQVTGAAEKSISILWYESAQLPYWKQEWARFTRATGIKVDVDLASWNDTYAKQVVAYGANTSPWDVVFGYPPWIMTFAPRGYYEPLERRLTPVQKALYPTGILEENMIDGHLYQIPRFIFLLHGFYRKDLFAQAGLEPPTNWDELVRAGQAIQALTNGRVDGFARKFGAPYQDFVVFIQGAGGRIWDNAGKPAFNSPEGIRALQFMVDLISKHKITPIATVGWDSSAYNRRAFADGRLAMTLDLSEAFVYFASPERSRVVEQWAPMLIPGQTVPSATRADVQGYSVPAFSKKKDLALQFIKWSITDPQAQEEQFRQVGFIPVMRPVYERMRDHTAIQWAEKQLQYPHQSFEIRRNVQEAIDILERQIRGALLGAISPAEALAGAERQILRLR